MTNDPLDPAEVTCWDRGLDRDPRFRAALRLDGIVNDGSARGDDIAGAGRFLHEWAARMQPAYMAVSLPDSFQFPADDTRTRLLAEAVIPVCRDLDTPFALMIGVRRQVNPELRLAGDVSGRADLRCLENLCLRFPEQKFLVTVLSRRESARAVRVCAQVPESGTVRVLVVFE